MTLYRSAICRQLLDDAFSRYHENKKINLSVISSKRKPCADNSSQLFHESALDTRSLINTKRGGKRRVVYNPNFV